MIFNIRTIIIITLFLALACWGCESSENEKESQPDAGSTATDTDTDVDSGAASEPDAGPTDEDSDYDGPRIITADWLEGTLSVARLDDVLAGGSSTRDEIVTDIIDVGEHPPGPIELEITPDGQTALVTVSSGFFAVPGAGMIFFGEATIPTGPGVVLFIDLNSLTVVGELETGDGPMGIAITPDSKRAFVPHFGSGHVVEIDIAGQSIIQSVEVGIFAEEIALDDTGSVGIFSYSAAGNIRTFAPDDMAGTLSEPLELPGDSAGVTFFPGTKIAYVVESWMPLTGAAPGYVLVDASDPSAPVMLKDHRFNDSSVSYPVISDGSRDSILLPITESDQLRLREYKLGDGDVELVATTDVTEATLLGAFALTVDGSGHVLCAVPRERLLTVTDLETQETFTIPWTKAVGPTDVAIF